MRGPERRYGPSRDRIVVVCLSSSWGSCFVVQITIRKPRRPRHLCKITNFGLLVGNPRPGEAQQWPWWVLAGHRWRHGCLLGGCWPAMETWVCAGQKWRHGCLLGACWPTMETWVCFGWVLISNGDGMRVGWVMIIHGDVMRVVWVLTAVSTGDTGVCLLGVRQQWRHGCVLVGC